MPRSSRFSQVISREILHGVTLPQLHQRASELLLQQVVEDQRHLTVSQSISLRDSQIGAHGEKSPQDAELKHNEPEKACLKPEKDPEDLEETKNYETETDVAVEDAAVTSLVQKDDVEVESQEKKLEIANESEAKAILDSEGYAPVYSESISEAYESFSSIRAKFNSALTKLSADPVASTSPSEKPDRQGTSKLDKGSLARSISISSTSSNEAKELSPPTDSQLELPSKLPKSQANQKPSLDLESKAGHPYSLEAEALGGYSVPPRPRNQSNVLIASNMAGDWRF